MTPFAITIVIYCVLLLVLVLGLPWLYKPIVRVGIVVSLALLLTYLTLFIFNQNPIFLSEETNALKLTETILERTIDSEPILSQEQIVLVDVAAHPQLLIQPQFPDSSATVLITNRDKLTCLFRWLALDSVQRYVGVVVSDVLLEDTTEQDSNLRHGLLSLAQHNKLLLAGPSEVPINAGEARFNLNDLPVYSVEVTKHEGMYFSHPLLDTHGRPSLPYAMYLHRQGLDPPVESRPRLFRERLKGSSSEGYWVSNWLVPYLILTDEDVTGILLTKSSSLFSRAFNWLINLIFGLPLSTVAIEDVRLLPVGLGAACQTDGQTYLIDQFRQAQNSGRRVTVFVGNFSGDKDVHQTVFGSMHGGLILINVYLNLVAKCHYFDWGHGLFLFLGYLLIVWTLLIRRIPIKGGQAMLTYQIKKPLLTETDNQPIGYWLKTGYSIVRFSRYTVREVGYNQLHYWLLLSVLIFSSIYFGRIVNVMGLTIFLAAVDFSLRGLKEAV